MTDMPTIRATVTLRVADEGDKRIWVTETPEEVRRLSESPRSLVTMNRVKALGTVEFSTQPGNIISVEEAR